MLQARMLSRMFEVSYGALFRNLEGITHEDSLVFPKPGGNCANWILGHIVSTRNRVLPLLNVIPIWPLETGFLYSGVGEAQWSVDKALDFHGIQMDLARTQQELLNALEGLPDDRLAQQVSADRTVAEAVGFLLWHESYHGGQIGLLRRILGMEGVIRAPARRRRRSDQFKLLNS